MNSFTLDIEKDGGIFTTDVDFWDLKTKSYKKCSLVLDTGASVTTVSKNILRRLGYSISNTPVSKVTTGSKIEYLNKIYVKKMKLGEFELENTEVHAHDFPPDCYFYGLLGLNIFTKFDVNFLFSQNMIEFTPIKAIY